jgi:hypothetical protein
MTTIMTVELVEGPVERCGSGAVGSDELSGMSSG